MKRIQETALIAEIVGGVAVILSLVFVGVQVRRNAAVLGAEAVFEGRDANSKMSRDMLTNPEFSDIVFRGHNDYTSLTDLEKMRYGFWVEEVLTHRMTAWNYAEQGLLDEEEVESWQSATCVFLQYPGARIVWDQGEPWFRADFRAAVERICFGNEGSS